MVGIINSHCYKYQSIYNQNGRDRAIYDFLAPLVGLSYQSIFHIELIPQIPIMFSFKKTLHMEACSHILGYIQSRLTSLEKMDVLPLELFKIWGSQRVFLKTEDWPYLGDF